MYLTLENIRNLDDIILGINTIEDEKEKEQFLEHMQAWLFLDNRLKQTLCFPVKEAD